MEEVMKRKLLIPITLLCAFVFYYAASGQEEASNVTIPVAVRALPESLDKLFPPQSETPLFLLQMRAQAEPLLAIFTDFIQGDLDNMNIDFENFRAEYLKTSKLVPEWQDYFPIGPVDKLGEALKSGDQGIIMGAFGNTAAVCEGCHRINMARVQQKYHWDDFEQIAMTDPLTNEDVPFPQLMLLMEASLSGITTDLRQGQVDNARKDMKGFAARFNTVTETCIACHDTERKYFIDENVMQMIDQLQAAMNQPKIDNEAVSELRQSIEDESCFKCHLVHRPAASARYFEAALKVSK